MSIELLLADPSPCLRLMVLRTFLARPSSDSEVNELERLRTRDTLYTELVSLQNADGSWSTLGTTFAGRKISITSLALARLGCLGFGPDDPSIRKGADFLFSRQTKDGSWPMTDEYDEEGDTISMTSLQTSFPLEGLARTGFVLDPRSEKAYDWLLSKRLPDGAWPTGMRSGVYRGVGGYRRLPHSRWGCRTNTTQALICLALHPGRRSSPEARRALDQLLACEIMNASTLGFQTARLLGFEKARGVLTFHKVFDPALMLDLSARIGVSAKADDRVADLVAFVRGLAGPSGLWEYAPNHAASRWVSFEIERSLRHVEGQKSNDEWQSLEPRTPFTPYPRKLKRY